jgi:hypothetical protein
MKTLQKTSLLFAAALSLLLLPAMVNAQPYTYLMNDVNGSWTATSQWASTGGGPSYPNAVDDTITTVNPNGGRTVTLDGNETVGNFDITVNANRSYTFNTGTTIPTSTLMLETTAANNPSGPSVQVKAGKTAGNVYFNAPLAGTQGFTLTAGTGSYSGGIGAFILGASSTGSTISGTINVNGGFLVVNGSLPVGAPVTINESSQAVLAGTGTVGDAVTLNAGMIFPGTAVMTSASPYVIYTPGTLTLGSLAWNASHTVINTTLGTSSSLLALSGAGGLTLTGSGTYGFNITQGTGFSTANTYTLMSFVNDPDPTLPVSEFTGAPTGMQFALDATDEYLLLEPSVPEPSTLALLIGGVVGVWQLRRRKA